MFSQINLRRVVTRRSRAAQQPSQPLEAVFDSSMNTLDSNTLQANDYEVSDDLIEVIQVREPSQDSFLIESSPSPSPEPVGVTFEDTERISGK